MADARTLLPRTYYAFLARFRHPSPIQRAAMEPLLAGEAALLISATASGKTEAFTAPLVERYFDTLKGGQEIVLLVCPTRALVNDAFRRLSKPLERCGMTASRRTGDTSDDPAGSDSSVWITTPEGFDSLLCRHARWLSRTRAVVLDEVHVLENSPRGSQAMILLERLDWVCRALNRPLPQRVAATATAALPRQLAGLYLGPGATLVQPLVERRPLRVHHHAWFHWSNLAKELGSLPNAHKVLMFANSRREAEEAAAELKGLPPFGSHVGVHHASLSRTVRLMAEKSFLSQRSGLLCCTTTMEVGVDVGDVDWVVMLHPPENPLSFAQRAGRSGRRGQPPQVLAVERNDGEVMRFRYLQARMTEPPSEVRAPAPVQLHGSVLCQQALSLLWQNPRKQVSPAALLQRLPPAFRAEWGAGEQPLDELFSSLEEGGWMVRSGELYGATEKLERLALRGELHSNIGGSGVREVEVRDAVTGRAIGMVQADRQGRVPAQLRLGGRSHSLRANARDTGSGTVWARPATLEANAESSKSFGPAAPVSLAAAQDFGAWMDAAPRCLLRHAGGNLLAHFLGSAWGELLRRQAEQNYPGSLIYADPYVVAWQGSFVPEVWNEDALLGRMVRTAGAIRSQLGLGRWHRSLPKSWQRQELRTALNWEWVRAVWLAAPLREVSGPASDRLKELLHREGGLDTSGFFPLAVEDL